MGAEPERENSSNGSIVMPKAAVHIAAVSVCFNRHTGIEIASGARRAMGPKATLSADKMNA